MVHGNGNVILPNPRTLDESWLTSIDDPHQYWSANFIYGIYIITYVYNTVIIEGLSLLQSIPVATTLISCSMLASPILTSGHHTDKL